MKMYIFWTKRFSARQPLGGSDAVVPKQSASGDSV